jgi:hypothetical protein
MNTQTIEILVTPTGQATVQTKGFTGSSCRQASKFIEQALGVVQSDTATAEMHQTEILDLEPGIESGARAGEEKPRSAR